MDFFGISVPQASLDISRYTELAPQNLLYDRSSRVYLATSDFKPLYAGTQPQQYLNQLLASETGILDQGTSFIGLRPPIASVPQPGREVAADVLAALLQAIYCAAGLKVSYQSMSRPEPSIRIISPHAFAYDGFRWHVRAFCHSRNEFRDFVLGRIIEVFSAESVESPVMEDKEWNTVLTLILAPNPALSAGKKRVIELDYGMKNGEVELECRQALLFYTLKRLGLYQRGDAQPEVQQIVLKNESDLSPYINSSAGNT